MVLVSVCQCVSYDVIVYDDIVYDVLEVCDKLKNGKPSHCFQQLLWTPEKHNEPRPPQVC